MIIGTERDYLKLRSLPDLETKRMGINTRVEITEHRLAGVVIASKTAYRSRTNSPKPHTIEYQVNPEYLTPQYFPVDANE